MNNKARTTLKIILIFCLGLMIGILDSTSSAGGGNSSKGNLLRDKSQISNETYIAEMRATDKVNEKILKNQLYLDYNATTREFNFKDGSNVSLYQFKLITNTSSTAGVGNETLFAEIQLSKFPVSNIALVDAIDFYDRKNSYNVESKSIKFKYKNRTLKDYSIGQQKFFDEWIEFTTLSQLPSQNITIGLFTNTTEGEHFEWVPTIKGVPLLEWADVTIDNSVHLTTNQYSSGRNLVWISNSTGYLFYSDDSAPVGLVVVNTTDGGTTWSSELEIQTGTAMGSYDVWYDRWTYGDTGTMIHVTYQTITSDALYYRALNTSSGSLSSEITIASHSSASADWSTAGYSITKSRGGTIYVAGWGTTTGSGANRGFFNATMSNGVASSFNERTDVADGDAVDKIKCLPARETNVEDIWCFYQDVSADAITLKVYNNTANTWNESATIDSLTEHAEFFGWDVVERFSDGHAILVLREGHNTAPMDLAVWDVANISSFTQKTDVDTGTFIYSPVGVMINQQNDELYVAYSNGTTLGNINYKNSSDGGTTWSSATRLSETADDHQAIYSGMMATSYGGRWTPVWFNEDLSDVVLSTLVSISIPPAPDTTKPTYTTIGVNSTYAGLSALFYNYWNDETNLTGGGYIFETNNSGTLTNDTFVSFTTTPSWANVTKVLNSSVGNVIAYRWYANDTAGNWNATSIQYLTTTELTSCWGTINGGIYVPSGCVYYIPDGETAYIT